MLKLARLMMLFAVAAFATSPVMACCLNGHADHEAEIVEVASSHCHGNSAQPETAESPEEHPAFPSPIDCPGCLDCDMGILQAQSIEVDALSNQSNSDSIHFAYHVTEFVGFEHKAIVLKTGPLGLIDRRPDTPLRLKQRLLI